MRSLYAVDLELLAKIRIQIIILALNFDLQISTKFLFDFFGKLLKKCSGLKNAGTESKVIQ